MLTKWEKRVIAVLLAIMMCIPMTGLSTMTANAEDTGAAVVQETPSAEEAQEPEEDVPESDGVFIPIEEEETDLAESDSEIQGEIPADEDASGQEAGSLEQDKEELSQAAKTVYADVPDEELPEITLNENGEPVRTTTELDGTSNFKKYIFSPEETGLYDLNILGYGGWGQIAQKTEDGETELDRQGDYSVSYRLYQLEQGETYYIYINYIYTYDMTKAVNARVTWDFSKVQEIKAGSYDTEITQTEQRRVYRLEYGETDFYCFEKRMYDSVASVWVENGEIECWPDYQPMYRQLDKTKDCFIEISFDSEFRTGNVLWSVEESALTEVTEGETVTTYIETDKQAPVYSFVPTADGRYRISSPYATLRVYDDEWKMLQSGYGCYADMTAGKTYFLYFENSRNQKIEWTINAANVTEVQVGVDYTAPERAVSYYKFTPDASGRYHFGSDQMYSMRIDNGNTMYAADHWVNLEAGRTYEIILEGEYSYNSVTWNVNLAVMQEITVGTDNTTPEIGRSEYCFTPEKSGDYMLTSANMGNCTIYHSDWTISDAYCYRTGNGFGAKMRLEEGETYYILIQPHEEQVYWRVDELGATGDYNYRELEDGTLEILNYTGDSERVEIPETIDGKKVAEIGIGAFAQNENLTEVSIPGSVTTLQYGAFQSCKNLKNVGFAEGSELETIGESAFQSCESLAEIEIPNGVKRIETSGFAKSGLTSVVLPDSVEEVGGNLFAQCGSLENVKLGKGIKNISYYMFKECSKLQKIDIPDGILSIGTEAFGLAGLESVVIPNSVTQLGDYVFISCESLKNVTLGSGIKGITNAMFSACSALTEINLPDNITFIKEGAFSKTGLIKIDIPDSVTSIGARAFYNCAQLKEATIGNGLAYVAEDAFSGCDLTELVIGNKVEKIARRSFQYNQNLTSVTIPNSVTEIEYNAFYGCKNLWDIEIPDSVEAIGQNAFGGTVWYENQNDGLVYAGKVLYKYKGEIPEGSGDIRIASGTKGIAGYAFFGQKNLTSVTIPMGVTNIGANAFTGCDSLTEITIPDTVTRIDQYAVGYASEAGRPMENFTIRGVKGSAAEQYADANGFNFEEVEFEIIKGDLDLSGKVDISDLRMVLRSVCGKVTLDEMQKLAADVQADGKIDINDLRKILRFICGKIGEL